MTQIVNLKHRKADVICDRRSRYGNMFHIGFHGTRDEVCDKYEKYFNENILTDYKFRASIHSLKGKTLGCWCRCIPECGHEKCKKQLRCHCETIKKYLDNL